MLMPSIRYSSRPLRERQICLRASKAESVVGLVINIREKVRLAVITLDAHRKPVSEKPRLRQGDDKVPPFQTILTADAKSLTTTDKSRPIEQIEICLLKLSKSHQTIDRAEAEHQS